MGLNCEEFKFELTIFFFLSSQYFFCEDRQVFRGGERYSCGDFGFSPGISQVRDRCWESVRTPGPRLPFFFK